MALQKITQTLLGGFQTSPSGRVEHSRVALRINNAIDAFESLNRDRSRTKSEKALMYAELQDRHGRAIKADLDRFGAELLKRTDYFDAKVDAVLKSVSLKDAVQTIANLKAAGMNSQQLAEAAHENPEIAVCMWRSPSGLSGWSEPVAKAAALRHHPEILELAEQNQNDYKSYESICRVADQTILTIGMDIDKQALAERFDPAKLSPEPQEKTQADTNAMLGKVEQTDFKKDTAEQVSEHIGAYGATYAGPKVSGK